MFNAEPIGVTVTVPINWLPSEIGLPLIATIASPSFTPAFSPGPPGVTCSTNTPSFTPATFRLVRARSVSLGGKRMPIPPRVTLPFLMMSLYTCAAVFMGRAKPMPWYPPLRVAIAVLMPMTSPRMFNSGRPPLPRFLGRVGLQEMRDLLGGVHIALLGADDTRRHGGLIVERRTDGNRPIAHLHGVGIADLRHRQVLLAFHPDHRQVGRHIHAHHFGVIFHRIVVERSEERRVGKECRS